MGNLATDKIQESIKTLRNKKSRIYLFTQDTKGNAKASIKYIYDIALTLKRNGFNPIILHEKNDYVSISESLGEGYGDIPHVSIESQQLKVNALLITSGLVKFNSLEQSTAINNGAVVIRGGVGILKNLNVGQDFKVFGKTVFEGPVTFNAGLIPETVESAYIGVSTHPWASAWIAGVGIATQGFPRNCCFVILNWRCRLWHSNSTD